MNMLAVEVPISGLGRAVVARRTLDAGHVKRLADVLDQCPPIVLTPSGAIIDGEHRVAAAAKLGRTHILAVTMDLDEVDALIQALQINSSHGLPLSSAERHEAVLLLLSRAPDRSDRFVASTCGVSRVTVGRARSAAEACSGGPDDHLNRRIGHDGKSHPAGRTDHRPLAEAIIRVEGDQSVRQLAARLGVSTGCAHAHRRAVLDALAGERRFVRFVRRLLARIKLWRLRRS